MQIRTININEVKPYWRNPRKNAKAVEQVKVSMQKYGVNMPILIDSNNVIVAGHCRYKALLELGKTEVPTVLFEGDEQQAKEYRIADNKTGEIAQWDTDLLSIEIREMHSADEVPGISAAELAKLLGAEAQGGIGKDDIDKAKEQEEGTMGGFNKAIQADNIKVVCPECGYEFGVSKRELLHEARGARK